MRLALAGDTMLGRAVAERLRERPPESLFAPELVEAVRSADLCCVNLECCISERGAPAPGRVFHFRAPPAAVEALAHLGVDCVTLANNHALDFGPEALLDTLEYLRAAGIRWVGAGRSEEEARAPARLEAGGDVLRVIGFADHPFADAAAPGRPGIAFLNLATEAIPEWLSNLLRDRAPGPVLVSPHWGPNMTAAPTPEVRFAADVLRRAGATVVAGHSAHVFHGVAGRVVFDLGDFIDDYRVDPALRNDLSLLWFVDLDEGELASLEALPLKLDYCHARPAGTEDAAWIARRLIASCAALGTSARVEGGRIVVDISPDS